MAYQPPFSGSFSNLLDRYREFVIDHLNLKERELDSVADLPDALAEVAEQDEVVVFVVGLDEAADVLRDDNRSEQTPHSEIHSFFDFAGIPVLTDRMSGYVAVALYDSGLKYVEEQVDSHPIRVSATPESDSVIDYHQVCFEPTSLEAMLFENRLKK